LISRNADCAEARSDMAYVIRGQGKRMTVPARRSDLPSFQGAGRWEHFPHDADIGLRGIGPTREAAFEQAALALTAAVTDLTRVKPQEAIEICCAAPNDELLLVEWLNALVFEMATRRMLFGSFSLRAEDGALHAVAWGEKVNVERHRPATEVKGATYTALRVRRGADGVWVAQCVVDV